MKNVLLASAVALAVSLIPVAQSSPSAQAAAQAPADPNAWTIDTSHSAANFGVRHLMVSTVRGTLGPVNGTIWYDGKSVSSVRADVVIDVTGINTANDGRDTHLKSADFFDVPNHPTITFKSKRVTAGAAGAFKLIGDLTMRGTTKEVTLDVEAPAATITQPGRNGGPATYRTGTTATTTVNRFDYGLKWNNLMADSNAVVSSDVRVTLDLELTKR